MIVIIIQSLVFSFVLMLILYVVAVFSTMSFWPKEEVDKDISLFVLRLLFIIFFIIGLIISIEERENGKLNTFEKLVNKTENI